MQTMIRSNTPITVDALRQKVPSIFAQAPKAGVSEKYTFIPTTSVLDLLQKEGWFPVAAGQGKAKNPDGKDFMKHVVRFRRDDSAKALKEVGDSIPELVLTNSHNASSSYRLMMGLFRLVCTNGLTVSSGDIADYRIRHTGFKTEDVLAASAQMISHIPTLAAKVEGMRTLKLNDDERLAFATQALGLRWDAGKAPIEASHLLMSRRGADNGHDLWTTLNVVQENIIRGGITGRSHGRTRRHYTTRAVNSPATDISLNRGIWEIAEAFTGKGA